MCYIRLDHVVLISVLVEAFAVLPAVPLGVHHPL